MEDYIKKNITNLKPSATLAINEKVKRFSKDGKKVFNFGFGQSPFPIPEKIISTLKEIESSKESVRLSRLRYDVGISTLKDVLIRQSELSNAKSKNINAIYNYNLNLDELERLTFLDKSKNCLGSNNTKIKDKESICNL